MISIVDLYDLFLHHPRVTTDSRVCPPGAIFFALRGERFDGNQYAVKALEAGCSYAVIDDPDCYVDERTIVVEDALVALQRLALHHRRILELPIIAVTGTNGKTTTKELMAAVLASKFNVLYTEGNLNNQIGVPLTLLRLTHDHEMAVIEMGASHPGDIKELVDIVRPNYGLVTNVAPAHLEGFGTLEGVIRTKGELFDYLRRVRGKVFLNNANPDLRAIAHGIETITYGYEDDSFASGQVVSCDPFLTFNWKQQGKIHTVDTHLVGAYNLDNVLAAVTVGRFFKIPAERISRAIAAYEPTNNRSQCKRTERNELIIDAYNANPASMRLALENFMTLSGSPKAVILGDMRELGSASDELHRGIIDLVGAGHFEKVLLCGEHFMRVGEAYSPFATTEELAEELRQLPLEGYHVLIKGSHSMGLERLVDLL